MASNPKFIGIPDDQRNCYVYRFIPVKYLYDLFDTGENVVVSPSKWDDPWENFILKGQKVPRKGWFGQCWTRLRASDAMWRIYSRDSKGVRIRSTPSKLASVSLCSDWKVFIGKVKYPKQDDLMQFAQSALGKLDDIRHMAKTLLMKRRAFRHEGEVRLLMFHKGHAAPDMERYKVNVAEMIDQIMLDPRLAKSDADQMKQKIRERTEFKGTILHSQLYSPPDIWLG